MGISKRICTHRFVVKVLARILDRIVGSLQTSRTGFWSGSTFLQGRRHEAVELNFGHIQRREEHWAIVDMKGKAGHTRTIPMPGWVKDVVDHWIQAANITSASCFVGCTRWGKPGERG
jgi:hypothetical protein